MTSLRPLQRKNAPCTIRLFSDSWSNILSRPRSTKCADDNGQSSTLIISLLSALYPHIPFILKFLLSSNSLISSYLDVLITPHVSDVPHFIVVAPSPLAPVGLCLLPSARSCFKHHLLALLNHLLVALLYHQIMFSHLLPQVCVTYFKHNFSTYETNPSCSLPNSSRCQYSCKRYPHILSNLLLLSLGKGQLRLPKLQCSMIHSIMQHWDEQHSIIPQHIADVTLGLSAQIDRGAEVGNISACNPEIVSYPYILSQMSHMLLMCILSQML